MNPKNFDPNIAYIEADDGNCFQVLNEAGDDWDEAAMSAAYHAWLAKQPAP